MTVRVVNKGADDYMGYSSDTKPYGGNAAGSNVKQGAKFYEIDTGARYIWYDGSWEEDKHLRYEIAKASALEME